MASPAFLVLALCAIAPAAAQMTASMVKNATGAAATTLQSISPPTLNVSLTFMLEDASSPVTTCTTMKLHAECTPKVHAASMDKVMISYTVPAAVRAGLLDTDRVQLKACYSNDSQIDRPWRKTNPIIAKSKKCPILIKGGLPITAPAAGVPFAPKNTAAIATYSIRAFVMRNASDVAATSYPIAFGDSKGYFQIDPIDSRPKGMKVAAGICSCVGPLMFLAYFAIISYKKKKV